MADVGQLLGSDVPFFFCPSAFVAGRGETVRPVVVEGTRWIVLVNRGLGSIPSGRTRIGCHQDGCHAAVAGPARNRPAITGELGQLIATAENDFEAPVFGAHENLREINGVCRPTEPRSRCCPEAGDGVWGVRGRGSRAPGPVQFVSENLMKVFVAPTCSGRLAGNTNYHDKPWLG